MRRERPGIGLFQPAARRDAVGDVHELAGEELAEVAEEAVLQQFGVERGHAVHMVCRGDAHVRHAHHLFRLLLDEGHAGETAVVVHVARGDLAEEDEVDLVDDLQVAREKLFEELHGPAFERLGHERMVGIIEDVGRDVPGVVPGEVVHVDQQAHHLRDGECGVRVVELDDSGLAEIAQVDLVVFRAAEEVLERSGDQEILLFQAKFLAFVVVVVRIEHAGDVLVQTGFEVGADIVALVELGEIEPVERLGGPQAERVHGVVAVAGNRGIVGHGFHILRVDPSAAVRVGVVADLLDMAAELDDACEFGTADFPRVAAAEPVVRLLDLVAVLDDLLEDAVVVADAVAERREFERGHGVEEACREASEAAVAEAGVNFLVADLVDVEPEFRHGFGGFLFDAEVDHGVAERTADQEFERNVMDDAWLFLFVFVASGDPVAHHEVADGVRQRVVEVDFDGFFRAFAEGTDQVVQEKLLQHFLRLFLRRHGFENSFLQGSETGCATGRTARAEVAGARFRTARDAAPSREHARKITTI